MTRPVFLDRSGRRARAWRVAGLALGAALTVLTLGFIVSVLIPPLLPEYGLHAAAPAALRPKLTTTRQARAREVARARLLAALAHHPPPPARRPSVLPASRRLPEAPHPGAGEPIVAGFYVNWDDNSFASFNQHAGRLDWVICEWAFVAPGGDSLRFKIDRKIFDRTRTMGDTAPPRIFLMVSNVDSATQLFDSRRLRTLLSGPAGRTRAVEQLTATVVRWGLAGVTVDFEDVPADLHDEVIAFVAALRARLAPLHRGVNEALPAGMDDALLRRYAEANDRVIVMLYDEHSGPRSVGPVASQRWYVDEARRVTRLVPREKVILAVGTYGYDWTDAQPGAAPEAKTYQDAIESAIDAGAVVRFDSAALEPFVTWSDPDSVDHELWMLDAVTAYDQIAATQSLGAAGVALWRLGAEDPSLWSVLGRHGLERRPQALADIPGGYDADIEGEGEILEIRSREHTGRRTVEVDRASGLITGERLVDPPAPDRVRKYGAARHRVALTFDDGPDGRWTPLILDTLRAHHAPATFFVIGQNVEAHIPLFRRMVADGHEVGNHTFTHPNLALVRPFMVRFQLDATERLIEALTNRRTAFFRPPYFGDAEPTTKDELVPVGIASQLGYVTIGLHIDSEDWTYPGPRKIVDTVLAQLGTGNIVLLHDGGGDRSETVAALGPLIDSLRARGDTLVLVSELVGMSRDRAMPPLPPRSAFARMVELGAYGGLGFVEWGFRWLFLVALVLGFGRLAIVTTLALIQRVRQHRDRSTPADYAPSVSVIVPAYNEAKVIGSTITSLLRQRYGGPLEIVVVDDGSPDATYDAALAARAANGDDARVAVHRKANGGKSSALNFGIERARGELVICLDADTVFAENTVAELVQPLADPRIGAVAGNAKVGNRVNMVTRWQAIEYVTSQNLDRRAFALLNSITVVPGAVGAWRTELVRRIGGFTDDTLAEDQDLTLAIRRAGYRIAYADAAVGYTEAPDTLRALAKQRFRWSFGTLQCLWKHRDALFRRRYGTLGSVALPNTAIFQLLLPWLSPFADLAFVISLCTVALDWVEHGPTYAVFSLQQIAALYAIFLLVDWLGTVAAFLMEPGEDRSLTWLIFLQRFVYRQLLYWVVWRSVRAAAAGHVVGWGKLERKATVGLPPAGDAAGSAGAA